MKEFDKVIGYTAIKKELEQIVDVIRNKDMYHKLGVSVPKGVLLYGVPGVGKSLMASAFIEASGLKVFVCRKDKPDSDFIHEIKSTFENATENAPSIVFLDDMDKFANGDENHPDTEAYVTVQSCIDDVKNKGVFVLATANNLRCLPKSLLRDGRFDRKIEVETPSIADSEKLIEFYLSNKKVSPDLDIKTIARIMQDYSCATLETVINEAGIYAGFDRAECITMEHFLKSAMKMLFDVPVSVLNSAEEMDKSDTLVKIAYHEAGHAILHEILDSGSITLISAYGSEYSFGGFTRAYHFEMADPLKKEKLEIIASLAGMAATEQKFGINDIGSSENLRYAFNGVKELIARYGMYGFNLYGEFHCVSKDLEIYQDRATAMELERYYRKAKEIIALNNEFFEAVANEIIEKKILTNADIQRIKVNHKITMESVKFFL